MSQVKEMVSVEIIKAGIVWLISMLNPASAFVKACKMIYDVVMFFVEKAAQIKEFVDSILDSVESIAGGGVGAVAGYIEKTLAKMVPVHHRLPRLAARPRRHLVEDQGDPREDPGAGRQGDRLGRRQGGGVREEGARARQEAAQQGQGVRQEGRRRASRRSSASSRRRRRTERRLDSLRAFGSRIGSLASPSGKTSSVANSPLRERKYAATLEPIAVFGKKWTINAVAQRKQEWASEAERSTECRFRSTGAGHLSTWVPATPQS